MWYRKVIIATLTDFDWEESDEPAVSHAANAEDESGEPKDFIMKANSGLIDSDSSSSSSSNSSKRSNRSSNINTNDDDNNNNDNDNINSK